MNRSYTALPGTSGSRQPIYSVSRINWGRQSNNLVLKYQIHSERNVVVKK